MSRGISEVLLDRNGRGRGAQKRKCGFEKHLKSCSGKSLKTFTRPQRKDGDNTSAVDVERIQMYKRKHSSMLPLISANIRGSSADGTSNVTLLYA